VRKDFLFWGTRLEHWLMRVVILCAVMMVTVQWFAYDPAVRVISKVDDDLRGNAGSSLTSLDHLVTFQLLDYSTLPRAAVLVNGEKRGSFQYRYVTVPVADGDELAIDAAFYEQPVSFKIIETYGNVRWPESGMIVKVHGTTKKIGKVIID